MSDSRSEFSGDDSERRVRRYSPQRLLDQPLVLPNGEIVTVERHKGRLMIRVEVPGDRRT
jgi:hypothetical protein